MCAKLKYHKLSDEQKKKYLGDFYSMVSLLQGGDEIKNFFKDLLTPSEMVMITRRIQIAKMLINGYVHVEIREKLGAGNTTISLVDRWLNDGFGGYRKILEKYKKEKEKSKKESEIRKIKKDEIIDPMSFKALRKKYPAHFILFNLFLDD